MRLRCYLASKVICLASELVTKAPSCNQVDANLLVQTSIFLGLLCQAVEVI